MKRTLSETTLNMNEVVGLVIRRGVGDDGALSDVSFYSNRHKALAAKLEYKKAVPRDFVYEPRLENYGTKEQLAACIAAGTYKLDQPLSFIVPMDYLVVYYTKSISAGRARIPVIAISLDKLKAKLDDIDPLAFDYSISIEPNAYPRLFQTAEELVSLIKGKVENK